MTATAPKVAVNVGQATPVNLIATVSGSNTTVEVTTENQPLLQSEDGNMSSTFSTAQLEALPIPGGDISNLPFTTPGVSLSTGDGYGNFTAFGLPSTSNLFTTNGSDLMDAFLNLPNSGASNNTLGANELSEAVVVVNGYTGQYGHLAGAQVNFTTKSGTNQFHGNGIFYYNSSGFNANDWFLKQQQVAPGSGLINAQPHAVSRQWGGSIGGPIVRDKLFAFFDDEGLRYVLPGGGSTTYLPSTAFQNAVLANITAKQPAELAFYKNVFSLYSGANGFKTAVPDTTAGDLGGCGDFAGTTVGGVTFGQATPCAVAFVPNNNNINTEQLYSARVDYNISSKDQVNVRYKHDWGVQATSTDPVNNAFSANSTQPESDGQLNETHIFSSNVVNTFTLASLYYGAVFGPPNFAAALAAFPTTFSFSDGDQFASLGGTDNAYPSGRNLSQYQVTDDLSIIRGKNSIKTGYNFRRYNITNFAPLAGASGITTFVSNTDFYNGTISASNGGGTSTTTVDFPAIGAGHLAIYSIGVYLQDQIAVNSKLNITASVRFDRQGNPACRSNCFVRLNAPFNQIAKGASVPYNASILTGQSNAFNNVEAVTFQPRIGFAFALSSKTVIRGGGGLFAEAGPPANVLTRFITSAPNYVAFTLTPSGAAAYPVQPSLATSSYSQLGLSNAAFQTGFKQGLTLAQIQANVKAVGSTFNAPNYTASTGNTLQNPKFAEYNLEIQQALGRHDVIDINYVGNVGTDILFVNPTGNGYAYCITTNRCPGGFGGFPTTQPDPRFTSVSTLTNDGHSNYNGVVTSFRHQGGYGITAALNYTWSHSLDNTSNGGLEGYNAGSEATYVLTEIDPTSPDRLNYGNSDYDFRHNFNANLVWIVPAKFQSHLLNSALAGWTISDTLFAKSALPYTIVRGSLSGSYTNSTNGGSVLGAYISGPIGPCGNPRQSCGIASDFATSATQYMYGVGNRSRNSFRGPGYFDDDAQISKSTAIGEKAKLKFGANVFNILNHPNFAAPVSNLASAKFGVIQTDIPPVSSPYGNFQGAGVSGRIIQVLGGVTF